MLAIFLNHFFLSLEITALIFLLLLGSLSTRALWFLLSSPLSAIYASTQDRVLAFLVLIVELVVIAFVATVILRLAIGGDTHAL